MIEKWKVRESRAGKESLLDKRSSWGEESIWGLTLTLVDEGDQIHLSQHAKLER